MLLVLRAQFSFQNQCISMFPSNCFQSWFCIVCWRAVRLTVTAVPFLFYSGHIKAQTPAHTNLAAAVQQACLCYYRWWMCVIPSIPLNRRVADPCVGPDWPQDLWASSGYGLLMKLHVCQGVCVKYTFDHFSADLGHTKHLLTFKSLKNPSNRVYCRETLLPCFTERLVCSGHLLGKHSTYGTMYSIYCILLCWLDFVSSVFGGASWNWIWIWK